MFPCSACHRHLRVEDSQCPFCGATQRAEPSPCPPALGAFAFAALMLGSIGCTGTPAGDGGDVTTNMGSTDESTTVSDTSDTQSTITDTETDTADTADSNSDGSLSFYAGPEVDQGVSECDPFAQDCPEGEKCVPYGNTGGNWNANKCVPVTGSGAAGDPCTWGGAAEATDDCDQDNACWNVMDVDGQNIGTCTPFCAGTPDDPSCPEGTTCMIANEGSITLCVDLCDPVAQDCPDNLGCYWAETDFLCLFTTQDIPAGEPCGFWNDCLAGLACADAMGVPNCEGAACCTEYCDLDAPVCPQVGTECTAFFEQGMAPLGYELVGVCLSP